MENNVNCCALESYEYGEELNGICGDDDDNEPCWCDCCSGLLVNKDDEALSE